MPTIDPTARVEEGAIIDETATIGPYCVIGSGVTIAANCRLISHVHVAGLTTIGANCTISPFASLGGAPQSLSYRGEPTRLEIGADCTIRENVTMSVGTVAGGGVTRIGDRGYFMNNSHVGHDCQIGKDVIVAGTAMIAGHCEIGDSVFIGGVTALHQHVRVGSGAMLGGMSGISTDLIPNGLASGARATLTGLNLVGMKRRQFTAARRAKVSSFYAQLFHGAGLFADRLVDLQDRKNDDPAIAEILTFIGTGKRSLCLPARE